MTVEIEAPVFTYTGNGATTGFAFPARFDDPNDILVGVNGVLKTTGVTRPPASAAGGTFVLTPAPANGARVVLLRKPPMTQLVDFEGSSVVLGRDLNTAVDKLALVTQYLNHSLNRTLRVQDLDTTTGSEMLKLPTAAERAMKVLAFDALGRPVALDTGGVAPAFPPVGDLNVSGDLNVAGEAFVDGLLHAQQPPAEADDDTVPTTAWVRDLLGDPDTGAGAATMIDSRQFGLIGDGVADDSAAFQNFINAVQDAGLPGFLAPGSYRIRDVSVTEPISIVGTSTGSELHDTAKGTWIVHANTAYSAIKFTGTAVRGAVLRGVAVRQVQAPVTTPAVLGSWTPTVYPPVFSVRDTFGAVLLEQIYFYGVYIGAEFINAGRSEMRGISGQCFKSLLVMDQQYDACSIANVHMWPFWSADMAVYYWLHLNHETFQIYRADSPVFSGKIFAYAGRIMFAFRRSSYGVASRVKIHSMQADAIPCGIYIGPTTSSPNDSVSIEIGTFDAQGQDVAVWNNGGGVLAAVADMPAILMDGCVDARVTIASMRTQIHDESVVRMTSPAGGDLTSGAKGCRVNIMYLRASSFNLGGGAALFNLGTTATATNGGWPVNQVNIGMQPFVEDGTSAPTLTPGSTGVVSVGGSGSGGGGTDQLTIGGTYVARVDAPSGVKGQALFRSTEGGGKQVFQIIAEGTNANVDIQLIPKGTGKIINAAGTELGAGGGGGDTIAGGSTPQATAVIVKGTGLTVNDGGIQSVLPPDGNVQGRAFNNTYNGGLGGAGNIVSYIDARALAVFNAQIGSATAGYASALGGGAVYYSSSSLYVGAGRVQTDGNVFGTAWNSANNGGLGGNGYLSSYIEARASAFSDINLKVKASIKPFKPGLDVVRAVQPKSFRYLQKAHLPQGEHHYVVAQDLLEVEPRLVRNHPGELHGDALVVDTKGMIATLWNAVRELAEQNDKLAARVAELEGKL